MSEKILRIDRIKNSDDRDLHEATITTDKGTIHIENCPPLYVGMYIEKQTVSINMKDISVYMPVDLGSLSETKRPEGSHGEESEENWDLERARRDCLFYYSLCDLFSYCQLVKFIYNKNLNNKRDIWYVYKHNPYPLIFGADERSNKKKITKNDNFNLFPEVCKRIVARTWKERLNEYKYAARYILGNNEVSGNSWMYYEDFETSFLKLMESMGKPMRYGSPRAILMHFDEFDIDPGMTGKEKVSKSETKFMETDIRGMVNQYKKTASPFPAFSPVNMEGFEEEQKKAVLGSMISRGRISVITGGPGTGKTTVLKKILDTMKEQYPDIAIRFLAPTGKAANRIKESLGNPENITISTVHKFCGINGSGYFDPSKLKEIRASGLVIVDEASMLDIKVFSILLNALDLSKAKVILVGDVNQLPSVSCGNILSDLIGINVPVFYLTKNHRNSGNILANAERIINGDPILIEDNHFKIYDNASALGHVITGLQISSQTLKEDLEMTEKKTKASFSPYIKKEHRGSAYQINKVAQQSLFKGKTPCGEFFIGDKVIFTRTDYDGGYFNGDQGYLRGYSKGHDVVSVDGEEKTVSYSTDISLAYSITIHKSQGSEYDEVIINIPEYSDFVTRRMLYTAITRAKEKVTIYGNRGALRRIILNNADAKRKTFLALQ